MLSQMRGGTSTFTSSKSTMMSAIVEVVGSINLVVPREGFV